MARTRRVVTLAVFQLLRGWLNSSAPEKVLCGWGKSEGTHSILSEARGEVGERRVARERGGAYPQVRDLRSVPVVERLVEFARVEKGGLRMGQASEGTHGARSEARGEGSEARSGAGAEVALTSMFVTLEVSQLLRGWLK